MHGLRQIDTLSIVTNRLTTESNDKSIANKVFGYLHANYGQFVGFFALFVSSSVVLYYYLQAYCPCGGQRQRLTRHQIQGDRIEAQRVQNELMLEERTNTMIEKREKRRKKIKEDLENATKILEERDLISFSEIEKTQTIDPSDITNYFLINPTHEIHKSKRYVSAYCAVCLDEYEVGNTIVWSTNFDCHHVFHEDCILTWLSKGKKRCPCCRQYFVQKSINNDEIAESPTTDTENTNVETGERGYNSNNHTQELTPNTHNTENTNVETGERGDNSNNHTQELTPNTHNTENTNVETGERDDNSNNHTQELTPNTHNTENTNVETGERGDNSCNHRQELIPNNTQMSDS